MASGKPILDAILTPAGYQQLTTLSSATGLTVPQGTIKAIIQAELQSIRWRDDGTNPEATVGMVIAAGSSIEYAGAFGAIKFIETVIGGRLNVTYYK